jgi:hypothetical protein
VEARLHNAKIVALNQVDKSVLGGDATRPGPGHLVTERLRLADPWSWYFSIWILISRLRCL